MLTIYLNRFVLHEKTGIGGGKEKLDEQQEDLRHSYQQVFINYKLWTKKIKYKNAKLPLVLLIPPIRSG